MLTSTTFTWIWIGVAVITFFYLLFFKTAPYGRHSSVNWGPMISNRLGWILMELPALLLFFVFFYTQKEFISYGVAVFLVLWFIHYFNRSVIFPLRIKTIGKKMPVVIMLSAIFFNTINTGIIASYLANNSEQYGLDWFTTWQFVLGLTLFVTGFFINQYSDYLLINLRKPGETNYKIPNGFLFRFISCPNLFGEVIEWLGFAIMTWCLPSWAFFIWTFANLVPRAISHHKWYLQKFPSYPKSRKSILPFVW